METKKLLWCDDFSIGNVEMDNDHKKIFEIYNDLVDIKQNREELAKVLSQMTDYTLIHFKKEEIYMQEISYPYLAEHKQSHYEYIRTVAMFNVNFFNSDSPSPTQIRAFIKKWWTNHILVNDSEYEKFKKSFQ